MDPPNKEPLVTAPFSRSVTWTSLSRKGSARWYYVVPLYLFQATSLTITIAILPAIKLKFFDGDSGVTTRVQSFFEVARAVFLVLMTGKLGSLSDAIGRRPFMLLGSLSTLVPLLCLLCSDNLWIYFIAFALMGLIGGDNASANNAYIADCSKECDRSRRFGFVGASFAIVFASGPLVGSLIEEDTSAQVVFVVALLAAALAVAIVLFLPESLPYDRRQQLQIKSVVNLLQPMKEFARKADTRLWLLVATRILRGLVMDANLTVSLFALKELVPSWNSEDNGILLSMIGCGMIVSQGILLPCFIQWGCGDAPLVLVSQGASALTSFLKVMLLCMFPSRTCLFAILFTGGCLSWFDPVFTKIITSGSEEHLGLVLGVFQSLDAVTAIVAPILFTATFAVGALWSFVLQAIFDALAFVSIALVVSRS